MYQQSHHSCSEFRRRHALHSHLTAGQAHEASAFEVVRVDADPREPAGRNRQSAEQIIDNLRETETKVVKVRTISRPAPHAIGSVPGWDNTQY